MENQTKQTECKRCGTCCRKGGPALHIEDQHLVASGKIPLKQLLTIRQGEPAYDNVADRIAPAVTDIIKINAAAGSASDCPFYSARARSCRIYDHRPLECNALKCWDTAEIESVYNTRRLTRRHVLANVEGMWDLVADHQQRCDYAYIAELTEKIRQQRQVEDATGQLLELIRYDGHLRDVTLERAKYDPGMLLFLFGRPLSFTISLFQIKMIKTEQGTTFESTGAEGDQVCYRRNGF